MNGLLDLSPDDHQLLIDYLDPFPVNAMTGSWCPHTADVSLVCLSRVLGMKCTIPLGCTSRPDALTTPPHSSYI